MGHQRLTQTEKETLLAIMVDGCTTSKQIAEHLSRDSNTISKRLSSIYRKAGAENLPDLILMITGHKASKLDWWGKDDLE